MAFAGGLLGYIGVFALLAASMTLAARGAARLVGVRGFRWFSAERGRSAAWRLVVIRLAAAAAPWCVSVLLFGAELALHGAPSTRTGNYVEVMPGPAEQAGMLTGDRVLRVGDQAVPSWDDMREAVQKQTGPVDIEVERGGQRRVLRVTPRQGRIAVTRQTANQRLSAGEVASRALAAPGIVVQATAKSLLARASGPVERTEMAGPVRIAQEVGNAGPRGFFGLFAVLCAYLWPMLVGIVLFELVTGVVFHATYPEAASNTQRGYRIARLHQALLLSTSAYVIGAGMFALASLDVPGSLLLTAWVMPAFISAYPLIAIAGSEVWPRPLVAVSLIGALFIPCVLLVVPLVLLRSLKLALQEQGFRFGWLRSEPPAQASQAAPA